MRTLFLTLFVLTSASSYGQRILTFREPKPALHFAAGFQMINPKRPESQPFKPSVYVISYYSFGPITVQYQPILDFDGKWMHRFGIDLEIARIKL